MRDGDPAGMRKRVAARPRDGSFIGLRAAAGRSRPLYNWFVSHDLLSESPPRMKNFDFIRLQLIIISLRLIVLRLIASSRRLRHRNDWTTTSERH
jgi:hypothetical protein